MKTIAFRINGQNIEQAIGIQVTFITEKKLQKKIFFNKKTLSFRRLICFILNPCYDGNVHTYAPTKQMKTMAFGINSQNTVEVFGIQVTFITEIKP